MSNYNELKQYVNTLHTLLDTLQPTLPSWRAAVSFEWKRLATLFYAYKPPQPTKKQLFQLEYASLCKKHGLHIGTKDDLTIGDIYRNEHPDDYDLDY